MIAHWITSGSWPTLLLWWFHCHMLIWSRLSWSRARSPRMCSLFSKFKRGSFGIGDKLFMKRKLNSTNIIARRTSQRKKKKLPLKKKPRCTKVLRNHRWFWRAKKENNNRRRKRRRRRPVLPDLMVMKSMRRISKMRKTMWPVIPVPQAAVKNQMEAVQAKIPTRTSLLKNRTLSKMSISISHRMYIIIPSAPIWQNAVHHYNKVLLLNNASLCSLCRYWYHFSSFMNLVSWNSKHQLNMPWQ